VNQRHTDTIFASFASGGHELTEAGKIVLYQSIMEQSDMTLVERLTSSTPKRILALDGGGIRGIVTLCYLERIEQLLRKRFQKPDLKLCEYFDLIGGTSTGAIIASGLAIGMDTASIKQLYLEIGDKIFASRKWKIWEAVLNADPLKQALKNLLGERTLGDSSIKTGLCIITKRADTGSLWPLINHPHGKFYDTNKDFLLCDVVRASTAIPMLFQPEKLEITHQMDGVFVDGGVSLALNPALQLFLVATLKGFRFNWPTGQDRLLLISVGTGTWNRANRDVGQSKVWSWAKHIPLLLMEDADWQNQLLLQYLSHSKTSWEIDMEVGDLSSDLLTPEPALTYLRYNIRLEADAMKSLGFPELMPKLTSLRNMIDASNYLDLSRIGEKAAELQVLEEHFPKSFDSPLYPM
jgi:predicted acylesterase/phospholipase RssA